MNASQPDPAVRHEFVMLEGERVSDGHYRLYGLPEGRNFHHKHSYTEVECGPLKVEGVAFASGHFEFGEHNTCIVVTQQTEGGHTDITFEEM